ncbi:RNA polymerase sigma factor [Dysosmobacter sp.]|uniref:RNA polymerase sigma factor n=1 Tax=Dysosmobacter sp. TaxID=2591382 RepID=UPI002A8D06C5|nr:sigma-70 family RNA polymerase sigma factor [Dysosmobacter sp.]MDY3984856.1 sigma-70 family RNA polymerase sigma factor [Dysosmobacter sp.]
MLTEQEFHQAAERYLDMTYRVALNWFRRPADAEDAVQETMLRLWRSDTDFADEEHLRRWLVRVTLNECRRISASPWRKRTVALESCRPPVLPDPARQTLYDEVMALPGKYRVPLYLYYYEGYSVAEVGELLGLKTSTVQTRLARGRGKLKTQLEEE